MASTGTPVVFIHGLWLHASSWLPWIEAFEAAGYAPIAPSWPGIPGTVEEARAHPEGMVHDGITEIADHYAGIIRSLGREAIVIGHSFGGLVALNLLGRGLAGAAVAIDAAPFKGVYVLPFSSLRASFPGLRNPTNRERAVALTPEQFRYAFANAVSEQESVDLYRRWAIPGPVRPLWQMALANVTPGAASTVDTGDESRGPLLLIAGEKDHTVPPSVTRSIFNRYRRSPALTELEEVPGRGHSLTIDSGWRDVADRSLSWLAQLAA
jgi:pimeloyl-ACP methyl ester carboxylesterase